MTSRGLTTVSGGEKSSGEISPRFKAHNYEDYEWENYSTGGGVSEIQEDLSSEVLNMNNRNIDPVIKSIGEEAEGISVLYGGGDDEAVYVAVGRQSEETSMDALIWALNNAVIPSSTVVFLIHVFPETKYIPTPLGKLPISQVNPEQKENYMIQETAKRRQFLQKILTLCSASQVKVDTILIESEMEAKAIVDLIPILNIKKLVLGTTKSDLRRMRSRRGNGVIDHILSNAPESCEVKIICEGNEMSELPLDSPSPSLSPRATDPAPIFAQKQPSSFPCGCFK